MAERGRPSLLDTLDLRQLKLLAIHGFTDAQLAEFYGVNPDTIAEWKNVSPVFSETLKEGKEFSDTRVERSLFERACGYEHPSEEIFCNKDGVVTRVPIVKKYAPDTVAAIFWLTNRKRMEWKDTKQIDHTSGGQPIQFSLSLPKETKI